MVVVPAIPTASVSTATAAKLLARRSPRHASRRSYQICSAKCRPFPPVAAARTQAPNGSFVGEEEQAVACATARTERSGYDLPANQNYDLPTTNHQPLTTNH